jgi:hypothetical protein
MSRGLGKVERAVLAALPENGSLRSVYQLTLDVFGPWHMDKYVYHLDEHAKLADPEDKRSVRRAVARLERAGLVETCPCMVTVPKIGTRDGYSDNPGFSYDAVVRFTRTRGRGVRLAQEGP